MIQMTPTKLIVLRLYNITLGRFEFASKLLRKVLLKILIEKPSSERYVASSRYFDVRELKR